MRKYEMIKKLQRELVELKCSICERDLLSDDMEYQEGIYIEEVGGYNSVFGDGNEFYIDICQHCFKEKLGKYITII